MYMRPENGVEILLFMYLRMITCCLNIYVW